MATEYWTPVPTKREEAEQRVAAAYAAKVAKAKADARPGEWVELTSLTGEKEPVQVIRVEGRWATVCGDDDHPRCVDVARLAAIWRD